MPSPHQSIVLDMRSSAREGVYKNAPVASGQSRAAKQTNPKKLKQACSSQKVSPEHSPKRRGPNSLRCQTGYHSSSPLGLRHTTRRKEAHQPTTPDASEARVRRQSFIEGGGPGGRAPKNFFLHNSKPRPYATSSPGPLTGAVSKRRCVLFLSLFAFLFYTCS